MWAARTTSAWGDAAATVALSLLVWDRTGSGLAAPSHVACQARLAPAAASLVRCALASQAARRCIAARLTRC